jgi:hypothetical protein
MADYCECGSIKIFNVCTNRRCPLLDSKQTSWIIDGELLLFPEPVTKAEAEKLREEGQAKVKNVYRQNKTREERLLKPWVDYERGKAD